MNNTQPMSNTTSVPVSKLDDPKAVTPMINKHTELLSPAGTLKNMRYAFAYGADAVYAGQPRYSLRVRNNEFTLPNLKVGIEYAHSLNKKFYVVVNIAPHNAKLKTFIKDLTPVIELKPDALIMSDPGLIMLVREAFPHIDIHLSVQANAVNWASVKFWQQYGITRVILSRELSLDEIGEIRREVPDIEIEIFVHGALCMAYSGRCLLSGYINKRDPNQGTCTNACRWNYNVETAQEDSVGNIVEIKNAAASDNAKYQAEIDVNVVDEKRTPSDQVFLLSEPMRAEEKMSAFEDEHGTYIMNSKDLRAVQHVEKMVNMGVDSLKIEGRTKSFYYVARTAQVYRRAIDDAKAGREFDKSLMGTLEGLAHRGYTEGFLRRHNHEDYQNYEYGYSVSTTQQFVGEFTGKRNGKWAEIDVKNKFLVGDNVEIMTPSGNLNFTIKAMLNRKNQAVEEAKGNGHFVFIEIDENIDLEHALIIRNLDGVDSRNPF